MNFVFLTLWFFPPCCDSVWFHSDSLTVSFSLEKVFLTLSTCLGVSRARPTELLF